MTPTFFATAADFRAWLEKHHATAAELVLGFYNKSSGKGGITYAEALDEALCFGWIDGLVRRLDAVSHSRRFTPRKPDSIWSRVNIAHIERLKKAGRLHPAGLAAFARRTAAKTAVYSFENRPENFPPALEKTFRSAKSAWTFWSQLPPGYRRTLTWWVVSAKQDDTRQRRLAVLIAECAAGRRIDLMKPPKISRP